MCLTPDPSSYLRAFTSRLMDLGSSLVSDYRGERVRLAVINLDPRSLPYEFRLSQVYSRDQGSSLAKLQTYFTCAQASNHASVIYIFKTNQLDPRSYYRNASRIVVQIVGPGLKFLFDPRSIGMMKIIKWYIQFRRLERYQ